MMQINRERPGVDEMKQLAKALPSSDRLLFRRLLQLLENFRMRDDNYRDLVVKSQGKQLEKEIIPYEEKSSCPLKSLIIAVARGVLSLVEFVRPKHGKELHCANEETLKELRGLLNKGHFGRSAGLLKLMISALATSIRYGPDSEKAGQPTHELVRGVHNSQKDVTFGQEPIDRLIIEIGSGVVDLLECAKQAALGRMENSDGDSTQAMVEEDVMIDGVTPHQQQDQAHRAVTSARSQKQQNHEAVATPVCQRPQNTATPPSRQHWVGKAAAAWPAPDAAQVAAAARGAAAAAAAAAASLPPASSSFECDECPRSFATEKGMRQHHSMMHKEAAQRRREERAASGAPSRARRSRSRSVVPPRASRAPSAARGVAADAAADSQFECDECGREFATERGMRTHHSRMHKEAAQRLREARAASIAPARAQRDRSASVAPRLARAKSAAPSSTAVLIMSARRRAEPLAKRPAAPAAHAAPAATDTTSLSDRAAASLKRAAGGLGATTPTPPSSPSPATTFNSVFAAATLCPAATSAVSAAASFNFAFAAAAAETYAVKATVSSIPYVCELCADKSFETERGLNLHHRRMHGEFAVRRQRAASLAPFRTRRSRSMSVAPRVERSKSAPATGHPCTECDQEFGSQQGLKAHYTKKHSDDAAKRRRYREFMSPARPPVKRARAATVAPEAADGPRRSILITAGKPTRFPAGARKFLHKLSN
ncbi:hypothetical protein PRIPAC_85898 [Pristionchus pacificus]|nr:hypothetical protein PRIPAC_85898 [Pristionchus pacificus]